MKKLLRASGSRKEEERETLVRRNSGYNSKNKSAL
jgi:hypothetical protein